MDNVGKIDLKEQLKSLFDTGINLNIGQIGAIQWAINQVAISKTETTNEPCKYCDKPIYLMWNVSFIDGYYEINDDCNFCSNCGRKLKGE